MTASTESISVARMSFINLLKSSSFRTGLSGITMREKWLVTPTGRIESNSGCTEVFVLGAMTPNLRR
jgi:hypothetical protein